MGAEAVIRRLAQPGDLGWVIGAHGEIYAREFGGDRSFDALVARIVADGRGQGPGGRLVDTCLNFARAAGYESVRLWTNHPLTAARRIYLSRGFVLVEEEAHHSFGVDLLGQTYELSASAPPSPRPPSR